MDSSVTNATKLAYTMLTFC